MGSGRAGRHRSRPTRRASLHIGSPGPPGNAKRSAGSSFVFVEPGWPADGQSFVYGGSGGENASKLVYSQVMAPSAPIVSTEISSTRIELSIVVSDSLFLPTNTDSPSSTQKSAASMVELLIRTSTSFPG